MSDAHLCALLLHVSCIRDATGLAIGRNAAYFALSRDTNTADLGYGWTFSSLVDLVPSYNQWPGCNEPCVDDREKACGTAYEDRTTWALYRRV
jgi:hypothetical protein